MRLLFDLPLIALRWFLMLLSRVSVSSPSLCHDSCLIFLVFPISLPFCLYLLSFCSSAFPYSSRFFSNTFAHLSLTLFLPFSPSFSFHFHFFAFLRLPFFQFEFLSFMLLLLLHLAILLSSFSQFRCAASLSSCYCSSSFCLLSLPLCLSSSSSLPFSFSDLVPLAFSSPPTCLRVVSMCSKSLSSSIMICP